LGDDRARATWADRDGPGARSCVHRCTAPVLAVQVHERRESATGFALAARCARPEPLLDRAHALSNERTASLTRYYRPRAHTDGAIRRAGSSASTGGPLTANGLADFKCASLVVLSLLLSIDLVTAAARSLVDQPIPEPPPLSDFLRPRPPSRYSFSRRCSPISQY